MTTSVRIPASDLVSAQITTNGSALKDTLLVREVTVERALNKLPQARIVIEDGDPSDETFAASELDALAPGADIDVLLGYHAKNKSVFKGVILRQAIEVDETGSSALTLICGDKAAALTVARGAKVFLNTTDGEAMSSLISEAGASASVDTTSPTLPHLAQSNATAWDFVLSRAGVNGMVVDVDNGTVSVKKPKFDSAKLDVLFGQSLIAMSLELDAATQLGTVKAQSWSPKEQTTVEASSAPETTNDQGNITGKTLSEVLKVSDYELRTTDPLDEAALKIWADAQLLRSRMARFRGWVSFPGNAAIVPGSALQLKGVGKRFAGPAYVAGVQHRMTDGQWVTEARFGLDERWFAEEHRDVSLPSAAARLPGATGLQIAKVVQVNEDPESAGRIKVTLPLLPSSEGIWVRMAQPYASEGFGITFLPEVGDEIVVGFLGGDPNTPVMLGALHSAKRAQTFVPEETNAQKSIVTKSKLTVSFDDEKKIIVVQTPGGHAITMNDEEKSIVIKDSNSNSVKMSEEGIDFSTPKTMTISADEKVSINGSAGITLSSEGDVSVSGSGVSVTAEAELSASGGASASVTSSGDLSITGTLVSIN